MESGQDQACAAVRSASGGVGVPGPSLPTHLAELPFGFNTIPPDGWEGGHPGRSRPYDCDCASPPSSPPDGVVAHPPHVIEDLRQNLQHPDKSRRLACIKRLNHAHAVARGDAPSRASRRRKARAESGNGRGGSPAGAAGSLLEQEHNEVEGITRSLYIGASRCRRHVCPCCGKIVGYHARNNIKERLAELQAEHGIAGDVQMWTLTLDQKRYAGSEDAWLDVGKRRRIGETMKAMGVRYYVCVLEWHKSGWPHWHVLIWEPVGRLRIDHAAMMKAWGLGGVNYRCRRRDAGGRLRRKPKPMAWAVNYITKYMTKSGKDSTPAWVWERSRVRMIWASRAWGAVVARGWSAACESDTDVTEAQGRVDARANREAVDDCGEEVRMVWRIVDRCSGEERWQYVGSAGLSWRSARTLIRRVAGVDPGRRSSARVPAGAVAERILRALTPGAGVIPRPMLS